MNYIEKDNIDEVTEGIVLSYLKEKAADITCVDIEGIIEDFFKLPIRYEKFAEDDPNTDGYISDGITPLMVWVNGKPIKKLFAKGTIIIDDYLNDYQNNHHRRFSLAHECSHYISHILYNTLLGVNHTGFDKERTYTMDELRKQFSITEAQMNTMAAALLMPKFLLDKTMKQFTNGEPIVIYGNSVLLKDDVDILKAMSKQLGVSMTALRIRLIKCNYLLQRPIEEFIENMKEVSELCHDCQ